LEPYVILGGFVDSRTVVGTAVGSGGMEIYACLGDKERVFEALDRAAVLGPIRIGWFLLRVDREHHGLLAGDPSLNRMLPMPKDLQRL
jgi:hypothetical protein